MYTQMPWMVAVVVSKLAKAGNSRIQAGKGKGKQYLAHIACVRASEGRMKP